MNKARVTTTVSGHGNGGKPEVRRRSTRQFSVAEPCEYLNLKLYGTATHSTGAITASEKEPESVKEAFLQGKCHTAHIQ